MRRNDLCFCGSGKKIKKCHDNMNSDSLVAQLLINFFVEKLNANILIFTK